MTTPVHFWCVIPAAGSGARMQSETPKQCLFLLHQQTRACAHAGTLAHTPACGGRDDCARGIGHAVARGGGVGLRHIKNQFCTALAVQPAPTVCGEGSKPCRKDWIGQKKWFWCTMPRASVCHTQSIDRLFVALDRGVSGAKYWPSRYMTVSNKWMEQTGCRKTQIVKPFGVRKRLKPLPCGTCVMHSNLQ